MDEINILIHRKSFIVKNKTGEKILKYILNGPKTSIPFELKKPLKLLLRNELLVLENNQYKITDYGRYVILANECGIRFLSLCALSEIYVMQSSFSNPKTGSYLTPLFLDKLDSVYSLVTLRMAFVGLGISGLTCNVCENKVRITDSSYLKLKKHDAILRNLRKWFVDTCDKIDEIIYSDPNIIENMKKNII